VQSHGGERGVLGRTRKLSIAWSQSKAIFAFETRQEHAHRKLFSNAVESMPNDQFSLPEKARHGAQGKNPVFGAFSIKLKTMWEWLIEVCVEIEKTIHV
jgi:hypothetical protein